MPVKKYECISHYQKIVGASLWKKKEDVKGLGGKSRLIDPKTDILQNYFGTPLIQNAGDIDKMISACKASMFHVAGYHENCPKNQNLRCQYQQDGLNGPNSYKGKGGLALDVRAAILPVYNDLCKRENLSKCLHGRTQNRNESFNAMEWYGIVYRRPIIWALISLGCLWCYYPF